MNLAPRCEHRIQAHTPSVAAQGRERLGKTRLNHSKWTGPGAEMMNTRWSSTVQLNPKLETLIEQSWETLSSEGQA